MHSPNLTQDNIARIRELFPSCVTEAVGADGKLKLAVDFDQLKQELSESIVEGPQERYHLNWPGKRIALLTANAPIAKTLRPCREESEDFDNTKNLFIEGDNLEALKLLQENYLGKVKMIYIDPPYNTRNDFIYEDDFAENTQEFLKKSNQKDEEGNRLVANTEANGRFHSDWLSMIYSRLKLARNLLSDDGAIFISIDDNEQANLKKICDDVFGAQNFVSLLSVEINPKGRKNSKFISVSNDYCLIYAKDKEQAYFVENIPKSASDMQEDEEGNFVHKSGKRVIVGENSFNKVVSNFSSEKHYSFYYNPVNRSHKIIIETDVNDINNKLIKEGFERFVSIRDGVFIENTYTKTKIEELMKCSALEFKSGKIFEKNFSDTIRMKSIITNKKYDALVNGEPCSYSIDVKTTSAGTDLKNLFNTKEVLFSAPKNTGLLKLLLTLIDGNDFLVLDFFAGSGTTAHSVFQTNSEDGGNRKFILVQLPELCEESSAAFKAGYKTIAEITKERIRLSGKKILEGDCNEGWEKDIGFRVLKIDSSNLTDIYYNPDSIVQTQLIDFTDNIKSDRNADDLLFQVLLDVGVDLSLPISKKTIQNKTVFFLNQEPYDLIACFDNGVNESLVKELANFKPLKVVFRDTGFESDAVKINVEQIFKQLSPKTEVKSI